MGAVKRTYELPAELVSRFEESVAPQRRSSVLAKILQDWMAEESRHDLADGVIAGCREMADVYLEIEHEFHPLEEEADRGCGGIPSPR